MNNKRRKMWKTVAIFVVSNMRFQMNVRILKIPPVFDDPKVFSKGNVVFDEPSILQSQSFSNDDMDFDDSKILMIPKCTNDKR